MNNGVEFQCLEFKSHNCEQSIQDVHPDNQHYQEERVRAVAVYVPTFQLVGPSSNLLSPAKERISTQGRGWLSSSILKGALITFSQVEITITISFG